MGRKDGFQGRTLLAPLLLCILLLSGILDTLEGQLYPPIQRVPRDIPLHSLPLSFPPPCPTPAARAVAVTYTVTLTPPRLPGGPFSPSSGRGRPERTEY